MLDLTKLISGIRVGDEGAPSWDHYFVFKLAPHSGSKLIAVTPCPSFLPSFCVNNLFWKRNQKASATSYLYLDKNLIWILSLAMALGHYSWIKTLRNIWLCKDPTYRTVKHFAKLINLNNLWWVTWIVQFVIFTGIIRPVVREVCKKMWWEDNANTDKSYSLTSFLHRLRDFVPYSYKI